MSCSSDSKKSNNNEDKSSNEINRESDSIFFKKPIVIFKPDTSIWKFSLLNSDSIDIVIGRVMLDAELQTSILSKDKSQILTLTFHPGSITNEFSEFNIKYNNSFKNDFLVMMEDEFVTESLIKLGITINDLVNIKGSPDSISGDEINIKYYYKLEEFESSKFLQKYQMPVYYSDYYFVNGQLAEFKFGFDYP